MAIEETIIIKGNLKQAEQSFKELTETIKEQKAITIDLEEELLRLKKLQEDTPKSALGMHKKLEKQIKHTTRELKDQRLAMKRLNLEKQNKKSDLSFIKNQKTLNKEIFHSRRNVGALNMVTNGYFGYLHKGVKLLKLTKLAFANASIGVKLFRTALIATGIGAIVVLVGSLIANLDKIKGLFNGVSKESKDLLKTQTESTALEEEKLSAIGKSENILKQQGKTEKDILGMKIAQTKNVITQLEAQLETQKEIKKQQEETAKRNQDILTGLLNFITMPLKAILMGIDKAANFLGIDSNLAGSIDETNKKLAEMAFSVPEETTKNIKDTEQKLVNLRNSLAGYEIQVTDIMQKEEEKRVENAIKAQEKLEDAIARIKEGAIDTDAERQEAELQKNRDFYNQLINEAILIYGIGSEQYNQLVEAGKKKEADINKKYADIGKKIANDEANAKLNAARAYATGLNAVSNLVGKSTAAGKGLAIASSLINTYASIAGQLKAFSKVPVPGYAIAQAVATGVQGFMAVKNILKTKIPGQSGGGGSVPSISTPTTAATPPAFNVVGASDTAQLASAIGEQEQQPVQAYVVSQDVTTAQSLENNIIEGATLGD